MEQLGKRNIAGVLCEGTRTTRTTPAGENGNDLPMELDEAARMHGASSFWKMILPLCRPIPTSAVTVASGGMVTFS